MIDKIIPFADEFDMFPGSGLVLACVSGGADSMALFEVLMDISQDRGFTVGAAHYNHRLRGDESDRDEAFVREVCAARGVPFFSGGGDVKEYAESHGLSLEEAARDMRYGFFYETVKKTGAVKAATAHTADDNAETLLMNFTRGAGAAGLSGIPPVRDIMIRPMLLVSRDEVISFVSGRGVNFVEDSTNALDVFTRNKIRMTVMPVLKGINPKLNESTSATAALLRADEEYLSGIADKFISERCLPLSRFETDVQELLNLPLAVSRRVIRKLYGEKKLTYDHVKAVLKLCSNEKPSARLSLPGMTVYREYGAIVFREIGDIHGFKPIYPEPGEHSIPELSMKITCKILTCGDTINKSLTSFLFKSVDICGRISVRPRREGDTIRILGRIGTKTLKKLFIEHRIPARKRTLIPVIADEKGVLAVYGLGMGSRAVPMPGDLALQLEFGIRNSEFGIGDESF